MFETIRIDTDARGVAHLWLARAQKHNALDAQMIDEITRAIKGLGSDAAIRAVVLAAEGISFCAGGDLRWMQANITATASERAAGARALAQMLAALNDCPKPLIGRIHGNAFGGGIGMMSVCDVTVGLPGLRFGLTETKLGLTPATISPYVVARIGAGKARSVFMSSRVFSAQEAVQLDLLSRLVNPVDLDAEIEAEVAPYLDCAPGAVAEAKALIRMLGPRLDSALQEATIAALVTRWESDEAREGLAAFFARRPPEWARK